MSKAGRQVGKYLQAISQHKLSRHEQMAMLLNSRLNSPATKLTSSARLLPERSSLRSSFSPMRRGLFDLRVSASWVCLGVTALVRTASVESGGTLVAANDGDRRSRGGSASTTIPDASIGGDGSCRDAVETHGDVGAGRWVWILASSEPECEWRSCAGERGALWLGSGGGGGGETSGSELPSSLQGQLVLADGAEEFLGESDGIAVLVVLGEFDAEEGRETGIPAGDLASVHLLLERGHGFDELGWQLDEGSIQSHLVREDLRFPIILGSLLQRPAILEHFLDSAATKAGTESVVDALGEGHVTQLLSRLSGLRGGDGGGGGGMGGMMPWIIVVVEAVGFLDGR